MSETLQYDLFWGKIPDSWTFETRQVIFFQNTMVLQA